MEIIDEKQLTASASCEEIHAECNVVIGQCETGVDTTELCDNHQNTDMKEEIAIARSVSTNAEISNGDEDDNPCVNMSIDYSKEESDFSDYGEENTRCQLANQAVRAKLLSSVANPANGSDSKLRVSVFDHRIIPKKFIIPKKAEVRSSVSSAMDTERGNKNLRPKDFGCDNIKDNKRKMSSLSYTVLKASKRYNREKSSDKSPNSPSTEGDNDVRTRFDILLRNLIGDVNDMKVEPSHVTVSSGYESDYTQNRELDNKPGKSINHTQQHDLNKDNLTGIISGVKSVNYLSETGANAHMNASLQGSHGFSSLPAFPTQNQETTSGTLQRCETGDVPLVNLAKQERDSQGFSYAQRHNYKLTKVTRSMYEIIHDLQNGEKATADGRKRSKKGRRSSQEQNSGTDGNASAREMRPRGRVQSSNSILDNQADQAFANKQLDVNTSSISGAVVRCVRRPLCNESQSIQRNLPHTEISNRLVTSPANNNCNKVQNDLRNLLCGTSDVTSSSADNHEHQVDFNALSGGNNTLSNISSTVNGHVDTGFNHTGVSISNELNTTQGQRRPTLNEQFMNRPKPDDHVYETIPGDEKFYEEWKKMRANPKIPKIRRFTTIPDLPGTFIPKEPPALPERKYLNSNEPQNKDTDNYIFMGDVNSNFPAKINLNPERSDSGYASVASGKMLERIQFYGYPYPLPEDGASQIGRHDETSDGYCSIDNLSLLRENISDMSFPEIPSRDWRISNTNSLPRLPPQRNDYFLSPMNKEEYRKNFSEVSRGPHRQMSRDKNFEMDQTLFDEPKKPVFQATYV
ncbi:uncharacterized protein LOC123528931 [Mercenaria mercenaria]|uniref:uncharacterized protein LOC123528931 n=1 Tax=Mercenaria mercenaria TaxID=6596 RepID=UPI00234E6CD1|nr:uncharacterized protein LOC123528931 [Mercenaria mercenaria]XP_045164944.2 uncharacterized protein LOC123528931 [Mercenaria mercenaria]XP_045164945.2 uncharacterized protein LOC123528931 [Mercenaria mercenaria]